MTEIHDVEFRMLSKADQQLLESARAVRRNAYAPYSDFEVGAALRTKNGEMFTGANMENISFGLSICAEVSALTAACSHGDLSVEVIAVVGGDTKSSGGNIVMPCGRCRQLIFEAASLGHTNTRVIGANSDLSRIAKLNIRDLLPAAFDPADLRKSKGRVSVA